MKKLRLLILTGIGMIGLSSCGTNIDDFNKERIFKGQEGLNKLQSVMEEKGRDINDFNDIYLSTTIDSYHFDWLTKIDLYNSYYALIKENIDFKGSSEVQISGLLGQLDNLEFESKSTLDSSVESAIGIHGIHVNEENYYFNDISIAASLKDKTLTIDLSDEDIGTAIDQFIDIPDYLFEMPELAQYKPSVNNIIDLITNDNREFVINNLPLLPISLFNEEQKEEFQERLNNYSAEAMNVMDDYLRKLFTVIDDVDSYTLEITFDKPVIDELITFLENAGFELGDQTISADDYRVDLTIVFDSNMIPTSLEFDYDFAFSIPDAYTTFNLSKAGSSIISLGNIE